MRLPTTTVLGCLTLALAPAARAQEEPGLRVLQRIYHPARPSEPFVDRGALEFAHGVASFIPDAQDVLGAYFTAYTTESEDATPVDLDSAVYQLALAHPGDTSPAQWHVAAVRACHVPLATAETLTLHLDAAGTPYALDYALDPVPADGRCGSKKARRKAIAELSTRSLNSTVIVRRPSVPPLPQLRTPPPLTAEGKPVVAPQEKSFIQKYWMYFAIAFLAIAVSGAPPEEGEGGQKK